MTNSGEETYFDLVLLTEEKKQHQEIFTIERQRQGGRVRGIREREEDEGEGKGEKNCKFCSLVSTSETSDVSVGRVSICQKDKPTAGLFPRKLCSCLFLKT